MLYLDYSATTPPRDEVVNTIRDVMDKFFGNPSSIHRLGVESERLVSKSRAVIAGVLGCKPEEVLFTGSGTESNNLAIKGAADRYRSRGRHLITSQVEHSSVYEPFKQLEAQGFEVTYLPVDGTGSVSLEDVRRELREDTILVSVMYVNNEMGRIQPVKQIGSLLKDSPKTLFHVDAIQSFGKLPCRPSELGADLLSVSAHKILGPKGAGFLYKREGVELTPLLAGGGQEFGFRSGTENVPLIVGMAKAVRMAHEEQPRTAQNLYALRRELIAKIKDIPGLKVSGSDKSDDMAPHIVHFTLEGVRSEVLVHALEEEGIYVSTRSACASGSVSPSRVLRAMGMDDERARSGVRVSFAPVHSGKDMDRIASVLRESAGRLVKYGD